jgi:hypothetical protein
MPIAGAAQRQKLNTDETEKARMRGIRPFYLGGGAWTELEKQIPPLRCGMTNNNGR